MNTFLQDLRFGLRLLVKSPGFAVVAVLTLAIGISANTAIFSVIDAVLLRPLAIKEPARVMYLDEVWRGLNPGLSVGNYADIHRRSSSFANAAASNSNSFNLAAEDFPAREQGEAVTWDYFSTFGVPPLAGRVFTADDDKPGAAPVAIISERLWRNRLHADPEIVGQTLRINSVPTTVVGIMPRSFDPLLTSSDIWVPAAFTAEQLADHDNHYLNMMARLKPFRERSPSST